MIRFYKVCYNDGSFTTEACKATNLIFLTLERCSTTP